MRRLLIVLVAAGGVLAGNSGHAEQADSALQPFVNRLAEASRAGEEFTPCAEAKQMLGFGKGGGQIADDTTHSYNSLHLDISIHLNLLSNTFSGDVIMIAEANQTLSQFSLNLKDCVIQTLTVNGTGAQYTHAGGEVTITPAAPIASGAQFIVETNYTGTIWGNNNWVGGIVRSPATDTIFSFGEPYDTRRWLACYDWPFDKVTSEMRVRIDEDYSVLSNGLLESVTDNGDGTKTHTWINNEATSTYLICFSAGPFVYIEDGPAGENNVPVDYWVLPQYEENASYDFGRTDEIIDYFEPLFGLYPFVKYDQAQTAIFGGWGAMEHQTATTMGHYLVATGTRVYENVVAHELSHQWWGDMVGPRTFANIWLNEGFASYAEALWAEHFSLEDRRETLSSFRSQYFNFDNSYRFPIYDPPEEQLFSTTVYKKGAWILHMLRWVVGDESFFAGLQHYRELHAYATATTPEFEAAMEEVSGMNLTRFFQEWVYDQGYPEYVFTSYSSEPGVNGYRMRLRLLQVQQAAPYFTAPLPILVHQIVSENPRVFADTLLRVQVLPLAEQTLVLDGLTLPPDSFEFDPDEWILCTSLYQAEIDERHPLPMEFRVSEGWPNPFNGAVSFEVTLQRAEPVHAAVYNLLGGKVAEVVNQRYFAGTHRFSWAPSPGTASGVYLIRVEAGMQTEIRKLVYLR